AVPRRRGRPFVGQLLRAGLLAPARVQTRRQRAAAASARIYGADAESSAIDCITGTNRQRRKPVSRQLLDLPQRRRQRRRPAAPRFVPRTRRVARTEQPGTVPRDRARWRAFAKWHGVVRTRADAGNGGR